MLKRTASGTEILVELSRVDHKPVGFEFNFSSLAVFTIPIEKDRSKSVQFLRGFTSNASDNRDEDLSSNFFTIWSARWILIVYLRKLFLMLFRITPAEFLFLQGIYGLSSGIAFCFLGIHLTPIIPKPCIPNNFSMK